MFSADDLVWLYESCLDAILTLRRRGATVHVAHIYREFNTQADSLANRILNGSGNIREAWNG